MIAYLLAGVAILAMVSGLAYKTYEAGADKVRTEWAEATLKAKSEAEAERARQEAVRTTQDREATRRLADARKRNQQLLSSLEAHIRASGTALDCPMPAGVFDAWNRANAGPQGLSTGTVHDPSRTTSPAR